MRRMPVELEVTSFLASLRSHDRSLGIASSKDRLLANEKAQNDWRDKFTLAYFEDTFRDLDWQETHRECFFSAHVYHSSL